MSERIFKVKRRLLSSLSFKYFWQDTRFVSLSYTNRIKRCQLASKITTSFEKISLHFQEYALGKGTIVTVQWKWNRLFNSVTLRIWLQSYKIIALRKMCKPPWKKQPAHWSSYPFISCSIWAVLYIAENTKLWKWPAENDCPLRLTECSTWLTYDALETMEKSNSWPALEIWVLPRDGSAGFSSDCALFSHLTLSGVSNEVVSL